MKAASISDLKQELQQETPAKLVELCLRLARFKKENKELLTYLLFEAHDVNAFIKSVKEEMDELFSTINLSNLYYVKKTLRKILRITNKYIRYSGSDIVAVELLMHFCSKLKETGIPIQRNTVIANIYSGQIKKIKQLISSLHEDLQYDYKRELDLLLDE